MQQRLFWWLAALGMGLVGGAFARACFEPTIEDIRQAARRTLEGPRPEDAEPLLRRWAARVPADSESYFHLGGLLRERDPVEGLVAYRRVHSGSPWEAPARLAEGDVLFAAGRLSEAEAVWTRLRPLVGDDKTLRGRFLALYGVELRRSEWLGLLWRMVDAKEAGFRELVQLNIADEVVWVGEGIVPLLERAVAADPHDRVCKRSLVLHYFATAQTHKIPPLVEALKTGAVEDSDWATILELRVREADRKKAADFLATIPAGTRDALEHRADFQSTLGRLALLDSRLDDAVKWLEESLVVAPFVGMTHHALATAQRLRGRTAKAELHAAVAQTLARIEQRTFNMQNANRGGSDEIRFLARDLVAVGMVEEARAWLQLGIAEHPTDAQLKKDFDAALAKPKTSSRHPPKNTVDPRRAAL